MGVVNGWIASIAGRSFGMGPTTHGRVTETRDVPVRMRDGVDLLTDLYQPRNASPLPVVLIRTPYGRRAIGGLMERSLSLRGYQVVSQSCRGTFGSGGEFLPFQSDAEDGVDTLKWIAAQPWYSGYVLMCGLSYPGYAEWALAADAPEGMLSGLVIQNAASRVYDVFRPHGTVGLANLLNWVYLQSIRYYLSTVSLIYTSLAHRRRRVAKASAHLPLTEADTIATGKPYPFFQQVLQSPHPDDALWQLTDHSSTVGGVDVPIHLIDGWYDFFLDPQLNDYASLVRAGKKPYLTIGPWSHGSTDAIRVGYSETMRWFKAATTGDWKSLRSKPVRVQLIGTREWCDFDEWPPLSQDRHLFLNGAGRLSPSAATRAGAPTKYRYDPADPTPSVGGALLYDGSGQVDNRELERRSDVLTFTTEPLSEPLEVVGVPRVRLFVRTTARTTDFFVRLCNVTRRGKSLNITDGIARFPICDHEMLDDGTIRIEVDLSATACRFETGHRIRLQVSSGAHPRYARNLGVENPAAELTDSQVASQEIFHDPDHPSEVVVPVLTGHLTKSLKA